MNILTVIMGVWLLIVAAAWCLDNGTEILAERKAVKQRKEAEKKAELAKQALTIAHFNNARMAIRRQSGNHRLTKVS